MIGRGTHGGKVRFAARYSKARRMAWLELVEDIERWRWLAKRPYRCQHGEPIVINTSNDPRFRRAPFYWCADCGALRYADERWELPGVWNRSL